MDVLESIAEKPLTVLEISQLTGIDAAEVYLKLRKEFFSGENLNIGNFRSSGMYLPRKRELVTREIRKHNGHPTYDIVSRTNDVTVNEMCWHGYLRELFDMPELYFKEDIRDHKEVEFGIIRILRLDAIKRPKYWHLNLRGYAQEKLLDAKEQLMKYFDEKPRLY